MTISIRRKAGDNENKSPEAGLSECSALLGARWWRREMSPDKNVKHSFDLAGMAAGDWFLGCNKCWFRHEPGTAAISVCPECRSELRIYDVTKDDVVSPNAS